MFACTTGARLTLFVPLKRGDVQCRLEITLNSLIDEIGAEPQLGTCRDLLSMYQGLKGCLILFIADPQRPFATMVTLFVRCSAFYSLVAFSVHVPVIAWGSPHRRVEKTLRSCSETS